MKKPQIKEKMKEITDKHLNCLPWLTTGAYILAKGDISRWQFGVMLSGILILIWHYVPSNPLEEMRKKDDKKRMEKMKIKKMIRKLKEAAGSLLISSVNNDEVRESMEMIKQVISDLEEWEEIDISECTKKGPGGLQNIGARDKIIERQDQ